MGWIKREGFESYEKLNLLFTEESIKDDFKILDNIFVNNPNFWGNKILYYNYGSKDRLDFLKLIANGSINIYKYTYKLPLDPKDENDEEILDLLCSWSRSKSNNTLWLYWLAHNFFKDKGYSLTQPELTSTYLSVRKGGDILTNDYNHFLEKDIEDIGKTIVRCGEIDADRVLLEIHYSLDSLWLFPFLHDEDINEDDTASCYLLEVTDNQPSIF